MFAKLIALMPRKVLYVALTAVLEAARGYAHARWPDVTLPSTDQVLALGAGLIGAHTLTDVVSLVKDAITAYAQTPKDPA